MFAVPSSSTGTAACSSAVHVEAAALEEQCLFLHPIVLQTASDYQYSFSLACGISGSHLLFTNS